MHFKVRHLTRYRYAGHVADSMGELRICPSASGSQRVEGRELRISPDAEVRAYRDAFGNRVECFAIPFRHNCLEVVSISEVWTSPLQPERSVLEVPMGEARQLLRGRDVELFFFTRPSVRVPRLKAGLLPGLPVFRPSDPVGQVLMELVNWIPDNFAYSTGSTRVDTPLEVFIEGRQGVCQDFAHLFLAVCRGLGLPCRYVSGYIEAQDPTVAGGAQLVGAMASHAWVEVLLPGNLWWGLDPTNRCVAGERHVRVAAGRDYPDVAPLRGTYRGGNTHRLDVEVELLRVPNHH